jgi:hypothetical protein
MIGFEDSTPSVHYIRRALMIPLLSVHYIRGFEDSTTVSPLIYIRGFEGSTPVSPLY